MIHVLLMRNTASILLNYITGPCVVLAWMMFSLSGCGRASSGDGNQPGTDSLGKNANPAEVAAFSLAQSNNNIGSFVQFLEKYPKSRYAQKASTQLDELSRIQAIESWKANAAPVPDFLKTRESLQEQMRYISRREGLMSELGSKAVGQLSKALSVLSTNASPKATAEEVLDSAKALASYSSGQDEALTPQTKTNEAIRFLALQAQLRHGCGLPSIPEIAASPEPSVSVIDALRTSSVQSSGVFGGADGFVAVIVGMTFCQAENRRVEVSICKGQLLTDKKGQDLNFTSDLSIRMHGKQFVLSAESDTEYLLFAQVGVETGNATIEPICPRGSGSVMRFHGLVTDFFPGTTFRAEGGIPLSFVLLPDAGLTYLCGRGTVTLKDGTTLVFPKPSTGDISQPLK